MVKKVDLSKKSYANKTNENKKTNNPDAKKKSQKSVKESEASDVSTNRALLILILGIALVGTLIIFGPKLLSVFFGDQKVIATDKYYFNGFLFQKVGPLWYTQIQKENLLFNLPMHYGPKELMDLDVNETTLKNAKNFVSFYINQFKETDTLMGLGYLTFDPKDNMSNVIMSATEMTLKLRDTYKIKLISSCIDNSTGTGCEGRSMITCNNTEFPVIFVNEINSGLDYGLGAPGIYVNDNCLIIQGNNDDILKYTDRLLYSLYQVMS